MNNISSLLSALVVGLVLTFTASAAVAQVQAERPALDEAKMETLREGGHLRTTERGNPNRAEIVAVLPIGIDQVAEILLDYDNYLSWYPDQVAAELVSREGNTAVATGTVRVPFPFRNRNYTIDVTGGESTYQGRRVARIQWQYREGSGNFEEMYGYWYLEQWEDDPANATLLRYVLWADLGVWLPNGIVNWATRRMLPGIVSGIQERHRARGGN